MLQREPSEGAQRVHEGHDAEGGMAGLVERLARLPPFPARGEAWRGLHEAQLFTPAALCMCDLCGCCPEIISAFINI